ncbi:MITOCHONDRIAL TRANSCRIPTION TERMINATION FACTOR FAMILY PROTEIN [Salix viminalis]|uniref:MITOCHONDRIAL TRANSCRIPTION TERMINATION FACTOR FAMILY PROTEIN n=1 Tax=Salix viminalis TaxID=40686 RepID=A0A9Q0SC10_SALVM|nr:MITOCHONDRIAL TRANSCRIPTION TERMINATION FACTOR FAMILY PROTEIN [Salix viminalis]
MIAQVNKSIVFSPVDIEISYKKQNPFLSSLQVKCFCSSRLSQNAKVSHSGSVQSPVILHSTRISRVARTDAQRVLFDYLHCTRNFDFNDAEHISKNSPHFIENLLTKIDNDKDVVRSLNKFLRYNPINEFEPFFESLGLRPSEVPLVLPPHLMYLGDNDMLLENFHVLCNYGIPRSKIGRIKTTVVKLVSCCPSLLIGGVDREFVNVLGRLNRAGLKNDLIGGYLSAKESYDWKRLIDTIDFLDKVGYSEEQFHDLLKTNPVLVFEGSGKKVYLLFGQLVKLGLKVNGIYSLFTQYPQILSAKRVKNLLRGIHILLGIGMGVEDIANIISTQMERLCSTALKGPKLKAAKYYPPGGPTNKLEKTAFLLRLGYVENSDEMARALKMFRGRGDQLQERFDCLVQAGLDYNVVSSFIKQAPMVLNQTKDVIEKKIACLTNLGCSIDSLVAFPSYLCYDMERINLRFRMYIWLREKGSAKPKLSLSTILACSDVRFIKYFVDVHPEGPAMWESLRNTPASS